MKRLDPSRIRREGAAGFTLTLHEVSKAFKARMDDHLRPLGLTSATTRVVGALACSGRALSQRELAEAISVEGPTLVRLLDRLESLGMVSRECAPRDRRVKHVSLTAKAEPLLDKMIATAQDIEREILTDIPEEEVAIAHRVLLKLRERLGGPPGC